MELRKQNILFFSRTMGFGGTSNVIIQLCKILKPEVNKIVVCSIGGPIVKSLSEMGIKHIKINDVGRHSPFNFIKVLKQLTKIKEKKKITVIHTHHRMSAFYTAILQKRFKFIFINTAHNTFENNKIMTRYAYKNANIIACGEMVKKNLAEFFGLPDNKITVIHNAVEAFDGDVKDIACLKELKERGFFLVGNIGRFTKQKGFEYFIDSYPLVKRQINKVKYILVGDGIDKEKLIHQIKSIGAEEDIILLGFRDDVQNVMAQLDLVVLSSLWEGFPLTPIESFSVGKTVIATAVDGTVEIVKNGENGYLIQPKNPAAIAEKVVYIVSHPELCRNLEEQARYTFIKEFSFNQFSKRILKYYDALLRYQNGKNKYID